MIDLAVFLVAVGVALGAVVWLLRRQRPLPTRAAPDPAPAHWVGITRYEGPDQAAADAAFLVLRDEAERIPGMVEQFEGVNHIRSFKVV